jgi:flagellar export protein FliJ
VPRDHRRIKRVLDIRALEEQSLRAHWAEAEARACHGEEAAAQASQDSSQARRDLSQAGQIGPRDARQALSDYSRLDSLARHTRSLAEQAGVQRREADDRRQPWTAKRQAVEGLRRLSEASRDELRREEEQREQAGLDEIAVARFLRATDLWTNPQSKKTSGSPSVAAADLSTQNRTYPPLAAPPSAGQA